MKGILLLGLISIGIGLISLFSISRSWGEAGSKDWPTTVGRVAGFHIEEKGSGFRTPDQFIVNVTFVYNYGGQTRTGFQAYSEHDYRDAARMESIYVPGARVAVWVDPSDPSRAVVRTDEAPPQSPIAISGLLAGLAGIGLLGWSGYGLLFGRRNERRFAGSSR